MFAGLLLRANGYVCEQGVIYYVGSKRRVHVGFDDMLVKQTLEMLEAAREMADGGEIPPPLEDSPKCPRCSLVGICLPDEVSFLKGSRYVVRPDDVRRLMPARDDALPMYVIAQGGVVGKSGDTLTVRVKGKTAAKARLLDVSSVSIFGNAQVTAQATRELLERGIPICHFTYGGWLKGVTWAWRIRTLSAHASVPGGRRPAGVVGDSEGDGDGEVAQQPGDASPQPPRSAGNDAGRDKAIDGDGGGGDSFGTLLGIEGAGARVYFAHFGGMIKSGISAFDFRTRNRRPPKDPVNAVLSFLYSMLIRQAMVSAMAVGFDPYMGFYHQPKYGRPALALDLAEEFRPLIADSAALTLFNNFRTEGEGFYPKGRGGFPDPGRAKGGDRSFRAEDGYFDNASSVQVLDQLPPDYGGAGAIVGPPLAGRTEEIPAFTTR